MKKLYYYVLGLVTVILVIGAAILLLTNNTNIKNMTDQNTTEQKSQITQTAESIVNNTQNIKLTVVGFDPKIVSIVSGTRVLWVNQSGVQATINSDPYPNNNLWSFLNLGIFENGQSMSVSFTKPGTYTYHNQLKPEQSGTVIVK